MTETPHGAAKPHPVKRFLPLIIIAIALAAFFGFGGQKYISLDVLRDNREALSAFVADNYILAVLGFITIYALLVAISFPGASLLTIFGGFLFGTWVGGGAVVIGATIGATLVFLAARSAIGDTLVQKAGPYLKKFEKGLKENEFNYLFVLRLIPAFPFWVVNLAPAAFDVKLRNYVLTTFLGIIPGSLVYASVGNGIGSVFDRGEDVNLSGLMLQPSIIGPIAGLILLALLPIVYKKVFKKAGPVDAEILD